MITMQLFYFICNTSIEPVFGMDTSPIHGFTLLVHTGIALVIFTSADLPVTEVCLSYLGLNEMKIIFLISIVHISTGY